MNKALETLLVKVAHVDEIPQRVGKEVKIDDNLDIAIFRLSSGKYRAVENKCPHKQGPLSEGIVSGEYVFCPLHDWKIDLTSGDVQKPDDGCVQTYPVEVINNEVFIKI